MSLVNEFLELKCSGDVINSVSPVKCLEKEISESMSLVKKIKKTLILNPNIYTIFDLCAGNCLTSSLIAHLLKPKHVFAIDKVKRERQGFSSIKNFSYLQWDIIKDNDILKGLIIKHSPFIIISIHPCSSLSNKIIDIFNFCKNYEYKDFDNCLALIPCCCGKNQIKHPTFISEKLSKYELWCLDLCRQFDGNGIVSKGCLSDKNIILYSNLK